jgi:hypothetical protein
MFDSISSEDEEEINDTYDFISDQSFEPPQTPTSGSDDEHGQTGHGGGDGDGDSAQDTGPKRKPGGYDSRIEQILYENPKLSILITDAGKSLESGGRYIVYTIKTGVRPSTASPSGHFTDHYVTGP